MNVAEGMSAMLTVMASRSGHRMDTEIMNLMRDRAMPAAPAT